MTYFVIDFKLRSEEKIFLINKYPTNLVEESMTFYGKCGNVRIRTKIESLFAVLENKVWRNLWQSEIKYGNS